MDAFIPVISLSPPLLPRRFLSPLSLSLSSSLPLSNYWHLTNSSKETHKIPSGYWSSLFGHFHIFSFLVALHPCHFSQIVGIFYCWVESSLPAASTYGFLILGSLWYSSFVYECLLYTFWFLTEWLDAWDSFVLRSRFDLIWAVLCIPGIPELRQSLGFQSSPPYWASFDLLTLAGWAFPLLHGF